MTPNKNWKRLIIPLIGTILGAVAGYIYYLKVGCVDGTCAITSNPYRSTIYGAVMGFLLGQIVQPNKKATT